MSTQVPSKAKLASTESEGSLEQKETVILEKVGCGVSSKSTLHCVPSSSVMQVLLVWLQQASLL